MSAPALSLLAKSLFLKHQVTRVFHNYDNENPPATSEILKCLLISRQFLRSSQLYKVYFFVVHGISSDNKFEIFLADGNVVGVGTTQLDLNLPAIQRWNQLLNVQYLYIWGYPSNHTAKYAELCKIFTGHVLIKFSGLYDTSEHPPCNVLTQLHKQLYLVICNAEYFLDPMKVPRLNLRVCVPTVINWYQIKHLLANHQIRKLSLRNEHRWSHPRFIDTIDDDYFTDFSLCCRLKKLLFTFDQLDESQEIVSKLTKMIKYFPNLTLLQCSLRADRHTSEQYSLQRLINWISRECKEIQHLLEITPDVYIQLCHSFRIRRQTSKQAVKQMIKDILKKKKYFDKLCSFEQKFDNGGQDPEARHYCVVELNCEKPSFFVFFRIIVDLDPETLSVEDAAEEDDNLLIPDAGASRYEFWD